MPVYGQFLHEQNDSEADTHLGRSKIKTTREPMFWVRVRTIFGKQITKLNVRQQAPKSSKTAIHTKHQEKYPVIHQMTLTMTAKYLLETWRRAKKPTFTQYQFMLKLENC